MIWFLLIVFIFALLMGVFQVPIWIMYSSVMAVILVFFLIRNPLLFGRDTKKMMTFLKKSKKPYLQFLYHFLNYDLSEAEKAMGKIRFGKLKKIAEMMLLLEQKQFGKAKELLRQIGENNAKWYALAYIAMSEGDAEALKQHKEKIKDIYLLKTLEVDQAVYDGKREEAVVMLEAMIPKLKGFKLLSAVQFLKQIQEGRI
ncbi:hypothetical protein ACFVSW_14385 [Neobacillus sp. NPDC058068]|uniref:hypothetical protein n=1 Tax=Neobacillus sp. NPDC058068 TaxID=3346325 RepID=UPI0036DE39E4